MNWKSKIILLLVVVQLVSSALITNAQNKVNDVFIGGSFGRPDQNFYSIGASLIFNSNEKKQYQLSLSNSQQYAGNISRFGFDLRISVNYFIKKRSIDSKKIYCMLSGNVYLAYYQRNTDFFSNEPLQTAVKRYNLGLLPGVSLNYNINERIQLNLKVLIGPSYYILYGPPCDGSSFECYDDIPEIYFDWVGDINLYLHYKLK